MRPTSKKVCPQAVYTVELVLVNLNPSTGWRSLTVHALSFEFGFNLGLLSLQNLLAGIRTDFITALQNTIKLILSILPEQEHKRLKFVKNVLL